MRKVGVGANQEKSTKDKVLESERVKALIEENAELKSLLAEAREEVKALRENGELPEDETENLEGKKKKAAQEKKGE